MCLLACNWSPSLRTLLLDGQADIDYIKTGVYGDFEPQFPTMRALKPILLHGLGYFEHSGMRNIGIIDFSKANDLITKCGSPHYGLHLAIENADMTARMSDEEIHVFMSRQIEVFKKELLVPLLLENIPDSPQDRTVFDHYPYTQAGKIRRLLIENDVGLLLDLTHAKITAQYREWDIVDYLGALPLDRVREIHVNGSGRDRQGFPADTHQSMGAEDYRLLGWVLGHSKPDIVTLEYSGIESEEEETVRRNLRHQLQELNQLCRMG